MKRSILTSLALLCLLQTAFCQLSAITGTQLGYLFLGAGLGAAAFRGRGGPGFIPPPPPPPGAYLPPPFIGPYPPPPFFFRRPMPFYG